MLYSITKKTSSPRVGLFLAIGFSTCLLAISANAATKTWIGGSTSWTSGSNWSAAGVPAATDDIVFGNQAGANSPSMVSANRTVRNLTWSRTAGALNINPATNASQTPIVLRVTGNFLTDADTSAFTLRSTGTGNSDVNYNVLQVTIDGNLTVNSALNFGDSSFTNVAVLDDSTDAGSSVYGVSVGGTTTVNSGGTLQISRLMAAADTSTGSINLGSLSMNGGTVYLFAGTTATTGAVAGSETITTVSRLDGASGTIAGNKAAGALTYGQLVINGTQDGNYGGTLSDGAVSSSSRVKLTKSGSSTLTLSGVNAYTGDTAVTAGTLLITGSLANTAVTVSGTGVFGGTGTVAGAVTLNSGGRLAPGTIGTGTLTVSNSVTLNDGSTASFQINGPAVGSQYEQVLISGVGSIFSLNGTNNLELTVGYTATVGDLFFLVDNQGNSAISGTFEQLNGSTMSLIQGAFFTVGGQAFQISYTGNAGSNTFTGGNDLVLQAVPEPSTFILFGLGAAGFLYVLRRRRSVN